MTVNVIVTKATPADMDAIQAIYAYHVLNGLGTFEEVPPPSREILSRFNYTISNGFPYLVAKLEGKVIGFAYLNYFRIRSAYRYTVEDSIYIDHNYIGLMVGSLLLKELISQAKASGFKQILAVIGDSNNQGSIKLHKKHGFTLTGTMHNVGYKFDKYVDVVIMQLTLD